MRTSRQEHRRRWASAAVVAVALAGIVGGLVPTAAGATDPGTTAPSTSIQSVDGTAPPPPTTPLAPEDPAPIPLPVAAVPVTDDPRVAPELAAVGAQSDGYRAAVVAYKGTDGRLQQTIASRAAATDRFDHAVADLATLVATVPRLEGDLRAATRREAKYADRLDAARVRLQAVLVDVYVAGGIGRSPEQDLEITHANDIATSRILVDSVQHHGLVEQAALTRAEQTQADLMTTLSAQLDDLRRRIADTTAARDVAAADRDRAAADQARLTVELATRHQAVADARLAAAIDGIDFPFVVLNAYVRAADTMAREDPACGIRWSLLAGIGRTETDHGTFGGATVDADGNESKPIYGIALDGSNGTALVPDTDGGTLDGDPTADRAVGSMQFIPGTWKRFARDGNGDGVADPQNMNDAALTAAAYLCFFGGGVGQPAGLRSAVNHYNADANYVAIVASRAAHYDRYRFPPVPKV